MEPRLIRRRGAPQDPYQLSDIIWSISVTLVIGLGMILSMLAGWRWQPTTLAVTNARVWTAKGWASAFAVQNDRFAYVGDEAGLKHWLTKETRVIDGGGKLMITPGFFDAHVHMIDAGIGLSSVQLHDVTSKDTFVARIRDYASTKKPGQWLLNGTLRAGLPLTTCQGAWDNTHWGGTRQSYFDDSACIVWVCRVDGHMCLANSLTLRVANVTAAPAGGEFVYDNAGKLTGILKDNAMDLITPVIPPLSDEELDSAVDAAVALLLSNGVTSVHHMGTWENVAPLKRARVSGRLKVRVKAALPLSAWSQVAEMVATKGSGDSWLRFNSIKGYADGSLGSLTALMFSPYGNPPSVGLQTTSTEDLYEWIKGADAAGLQPCIHAIGDKGNSVVLDVFERVVRENPQRGDARRFRVEHAQHIQTSDFDRFAELGVIASMQPYHLIDDGRWAEELIGTYRCATSYAMRSFLNAGVKIAAGSDWSVAPAVPLLGLYAAVTRATLDGKHPDGWFPEQKISIDEALHAYTTDAAYADFEEKQLGVIERGMLADFTVLSTDITAGSPEDIPQARVLMTVVGGKTMYDVLNQRQ